MKEKWVRINTIEGYEEVKDYYYLSNSDEDKIINKNTGKRLKIRINGGSYPIVDLMTKDGKYRTCYLHVLKAKAFIYSPNPLGANIVRHLNDVKYDNRLINLAFGTLSNNTQDSIRNGSYNYKGAIRGLAKGSAKGSAITAKKRSKPVRCVETGIIYSSAKEAERLTGIRNGNINSCCNGRCKTAGGYHFEYVNQRN